MIAYVDADLRVHVAGSDGSRPKALESGSSACTWPVWSPLGSRLAFSGLTSGSNGSGHIRLHVHDLTEEPAKTDYDNEPGADGIAPRTPHYALWSPDGQRLAFVARTWTGGLSLFVWDRADEGPHERLLEGGPLFLSWSPDS